MTFFTAFTRNFYIIFICYGVTLRVRGHFLIESIMTRRDDGKTSLVEFLRSIKFTHQNNTVVEEECPTHFAHFSQRDRNTGKDSVEDCQLIRSAN